MNEIVEYVYMGTGFNLMMVLALIWFSSRAKKELDKRELVIKRLKNRLATYESINQ